MEGRMEIRGEAPGPVDRKASRIVVVDDEPFILMLHAHMLRQIGFLNVSTFSAGPLALAHMEESEGPPDLILLDLSMPGMDGIEFIRHLVTRSYEGSLILISGEDERLRQAATRLVQAHGLDVLGHLSKPVEPVGLGGLLRKWGIRSGEIRRLPDRPYAAAEISRGIERGEFLNHYQPKVSVRTGEFLGVEALARWQHPEDGLVPPGRFIAIAEEQGLIGELTRVVFRKAMIDIKALENAGLTLHVGVNLAMPMLTSIDFADFAAREASRSRMPTDRIVFEITESRLMADSRAPLEVLTRLRLMRFTLSIDDFGTGYSSFAQLNQIPFEELKIDQSFVHRAPTDATARAIFDASLSLAQKLGMNSVAEGVEDREDWDQLRRTGSDAAQGYFIGHPMEAAALPAWAVDWGQRFATDLSGS